MTPMCAASTDFGSFLLGHWIDSIGNSVIVSRSTTNQHELTAVITPIAEHPDARDHVLTIRQTVNLQWRCGNSSLQWADGNQQKIVCITDDGRRCVWSRAGDARISDVLLHHGISFPWLLNGAAAEPWLPLEIPRDILYDAARVAALLDIRQMIGARNEPQERLSRIIIDYDLHPERGDYLIPGHDSPFWDTLDVPEDLRKSIRQRIKRVPHEAISQRLQWASESEIWVGHHRITVCQKDIQTLESRWVLPATDERKPLEIARLLALYSVLDNPMSDRRNGVHLGLEPELRRQCDYEVFASPLNAAVPNGCFASKWPHVEWRFGSMGSYPSVLSSLPDNSVVEINPPFTAVFLADVMSRLDELKSRFRLRIAVPIQDAPWRAKLLDSLPNAELLKTYWDNSSETHTNVLHSTLYWEDPRCPKLWHPPEDLRCPKSWQWDEGKEADVSPGLAFSPLTPQWPAAAACAAMLIAPAKSEV